VKFEKGTAREGELNYQHVSSFIRTALEFGYRGVIPRDRAHAMSIGVAAQFELMLRQMDIIGEWAPIGATRKLPAGIATLDRRMIRPSSGPASSPVRTSPAGAGA